MVQITNPFVGLHFEITLSIQSFYLITFFLQS